jgi:hypothetical protein
MATCVVSFVDTLGFRHTVEVQAESLFEAGVLAIRAFKQNGCPPGYVSEMEVEIRSPSGILLLPSGFRNGWRVGQRARRKR